MDWEVFDLFLLSNSLDIVSWMSCHLCLLALAPSLIRSPHLLLSHFTEFTEKKSQAALNRTL